MSVKAKPHAADFKDSKMGLGVIEAAILLSYQYQWVKRKALFSLDLAKLEAKKCGRTDSILSILPSDPAEPTPESLEIHTLSMSPLPISNRVDPTQPSDQNHLRLLALTTVWRLCTSRLLDNLGIFWSS